METNDKEAIRLRPQPTPPSAFSHYYGDTVRRIFLAGGLIMLVTLPFFNEFLPISGVVSLLTILVISVAAGLTNPIQRWAMMLDVIASAIGVIAFEYHAVSGYGTIPWVLFGVDQLLAILFFFALYLSTKTLRGITVSDYTIRQHKREAREREQTTLLKH